MARMIIAIIALILAGIAFGSAGTCVIAFNLYKAYLNARLCKRYRYEVLRFSAHLEDYLHLLQKQLLDGTYRLSSSVM